MGMKVFVFHGLIHVLLEEPKIYQLNVLDLCGLPHVFSNVPLSRNLAFDLK